MLSKTIKTILAMAILALLLLSGCFPSRDKDDSSIPKVAIDVGGEPAVPPVPLAGTPTGEQPGAPSSQEPAKAPPASEQIPSQPPAVQPASPSSPASSPPPVEQQQAQQPAQQGQQAPSAPSYGEGISPISSDDPNEWLEIGKLNARRTSRDKGELKEMDITVRNIGTYAFYPVIYMTFEYGLVGDSELPRIVEQKFELPNLKPGLKITRTFPVSVRFHEIDKSKTIKLRMQEKYVSPSYDFAKTAKTFIPRDIFESQNIKWT